MLEAEGYDVALAENGKVALEKLRGGLQPGLILLDLMMPVLDGFEFCDLWKSDSTLRAIPLIVVSADGGTDEKAKSCGATGALRKPLQLDTLLGVVAQYAHG